MGVPTRGSTQRVNVLRSGWPCASPLSESHLSISGIYSHEDLTSWDNTRISPGNALRYSDGFTIAMSSLQKLNHTFDVCVIGGGFAGICAAIASARNGAKTAIVHDRPVFGGNASSEVRMWICGAHGKHNKETGLIEEIQLENQYLNPSLNYSIWDGVLYAKVHFQPNLTAFMNCTCNNAEMDGNRIKSITAWQLTSQSWHTIKASLFIDCSGDSILAAVTPALSRSGREARDEFGEDIEPANADKKTMGSSLLLQMRRTSENQPYVAPKWAYKFTSPEDIPNRLDGLKATNFWWLEIGGLKDTISDAELIRDELMKVAYGVWDYYKNFAPEHEKIAYWALEWIGALPGKRESRRYIGDHVLTQNDVRDGGLFDDIVAYGGWPMDDHHPAGLLYPGEPTIFHPAPSPYGIPFRSLYSRNIENLLFAGRNISVTHAALSSTRVMATCSLLGQAVGTAAAICIRRGVDPRSLGVGAPLRELQETLMDDDCWLPGINRPISQLASSATIATTGAGAELLLDGLERDRPDENHAWTGMAGSTIEMHWNEPVQIDGVRLVFDSNLNNAKQMPCTYPQKGDRIKVPKSLVKQYRIEALGEDGRWSCVFHECNNYQRLIQNPLNIHTRGLRLAVEDSWGDEEIRVFSFEPIAPFVNKIPKIPDGPHISFVRSQVAPTDLAPPDSVVEADAKLHGQSA
jgi:hypothetical protein